jgi:hypothetical protein
VNSSSRESEQKFFERTVLSGNLPKKWVAPLSRIVTEQFGETLLALLPLLRNAEKRAGARSEAEIGVEVFMYRIPRRTIRARGGRELKKRKSRPR